MQKMRPSSVVIFVVFVCNVRGLLAQGNQCPDTSKRCLKVFDHNPRDLPKCYCTRLCKDDLVQLAGGCSSNQLLADDCGTCLKCARALGQTCGGLRNSKGVCAGGLVCKVRLPPTSIDRRKDEQRSTGVCVRQDDEECARSTDTDDELLQKQLISCRPGLLGILAEALYCPDFSGRDQCARTPIAGVSSANGNESATDDKDRQPTLLEVLLSSGPPGNRNRRRQQNRNK